ncbi:MAG: histidine kinase dimerization/phospho-acceptor domain-containing protein, partial [Patescibacteria group bacterium]
MFRSARLKLTAWYLTIIMIVSITFSAAIYHVLTREIERFERTNRFRIEHRLEPNRRMTTPLPVMVELIEETRQRILLMLGLVNIGIFVVAGGLGFLLAGRTLSPIQTMVEEQDRFISDASHELRTPLTSLKSAFEVYLRQKNPGSSQSHTLAAESLQEVDKLQSLSESLLELARYQQSNNNLPITSLSITEIIDNAIHY